MVKVVSWNIGKREKPWRELVQMASEGAADLALLQEAGSPPGDVVDRIEYVDGVFWNRHLYDRWPLVVKLSDRITVEPYRQVPPTSDLGEEAIGVSGIGTIAAARVTPRDNADASFVAVSMYARWLKPHPSTKSRWRVGYADASAHRILSDLSAFIGHADPTKQRILAAGDLNMFYGATGSRLSLPTRDRTVWDRMQALGLEFLGPQAPHGRCAKLGPDDVPPDTKNVPTYYRPGTGPKTAVNQLDYAFASRGFHEKVSVRAMNEIEEWGPSDHCRLMIEVKDNARVAVPKESRAARFVQPASGGEVIKKRDGIVKLRPQVAEYADDEPAARHCQVADERAFFSLGAERPSLGQPAHVTSSH